MKFETLQECMAEMTRCEDSLNTAQQRFELLAPRPTQQKTLTPESHLHQRFSEREETSLHQWEDDSLSCEFTKAIRAKAKQCLD